MKITVDGVSNPLIMRPTSDVVETKNSLRFNELNASGSIGRASVPRSAAVQKAVDSRR